MADALQSPWLIGVLLLILVLLAWCNVTGPQKLRLMLRTSLTLRPSKQVFREHVDMQDRYMAVLLSTAILSISVFLYQVGVLSGRLAPEQISLLTIAGITVLIVLASSLLLRSLAWLFKTMDGLSQYIAHGILQFILLGLLLIPLSLMLTFAPISREILVIIGLVLMLLVLVIRWLRGFSLGIGAGISPMYIVLYLCAAEILPALIGLKMLGVSPLI